MPFFYLTGHLSRSITPECTHPGLGSFHFARRYFGNRFFFLFLRLLRCFSSPGSPCMPMYSACSDWSSSRRVSPFRHLRINGHLLLPAAFRSLSRLSSALSAKASTIRSFSHDQQIRDTGCSLIDTDIALSALVLGQFLFCLFSSDSNYYLFITITSDVLILDI